MLAGDQMKTAMTMNRRTFVRTLPGLAVVAASQGLAAWFHNCNREAATKDFKLRSEPRVLYAQTVGYRA